MNLEENTNCKWCKNIRFLCNKLKRIDWNFAERSCDWVASEKNIN